MKIKRFPQSCFMIETNGVKILVDPGDIKMEEKFYEDFYQADLILVTHKHGDHCSDEVIQNIMNKGEIKLYSTNEVKNNHPDLEVTIIKEGDTIQLNSIAIEVVHAEHGYIPPMKKNGGKVIENVGYIIDDGKKRLYITSDTICFQNDYQCDILCAPISDFGVVMGAFEVALLAKDVNCELVIPCHLDAPSYPINYEFAKKQFEDKGVDYELLKIGESIEV